MASSASILNQRPYSKLRNPHPTSVLAQLSAERKEQLHAWLKGSISYTEIVKQMQQQWGIKTWTTSLSIYYHKLLADELITQRSRALGVAEQVSNAISKKPGKFNQAIFDTVERTYFDLLRDKEAHPKVIEIFSKQYQRLCEHQLRNRILKVKERRIRLLEKQAAEARRATLDSKLTDEERAKRIRQIFNPAFDEVQAGGNGFDA